MFQPELKCEISGKSKEKIKTCDLWKWASASLAIKHFVTSNFQLFRMAVANKMFSWNKCWTSAFNTVYDLLTKLKNGKKKFWMNIRVVNVLNMFLQNFGHSQPQRTYKKVLRERSFSL